MNQIDLKGKKAVITGGARGIGFAIAQRLTQSGAQCSLWDQNESRLESAREALSKESKERPCHSQKVDLSNQAQVEAAVKETVRALGTIDILVNNAGIAGESKKLWESDPADWRRVIEVDLIAVYLCCRAVVPIMMQKSYGRIVNIASIAGKEGNPLASHYSAAKAGVIALTKSLGKELAKTGVIVNAIAPAVVQTEILEQVSKEHIDYMVSRIPMGRVGKAEEVAALVAWLSSEDCSFSTAAVYDISGGRATY